MKIILALASLAVFLSGTPVFAEEIKVGFFQWPPLMEAAGDQTKPTGLLVDHYENVIAKKLGVTIKWLGPYPIPRVVYMLETNEIDIIPALSKTPDREKIMAFPGKRLYYMLAVVCVKNGSTLKSINSWEDLEGMKLGINYGSAFHKKLSKNQPHLNFARIRLETEPIKYALELVVGGELAAYVHPDRIIVKILSKRWDLENKLKILDAPVPKRGPYTAISLGRPDLLKKWNKHGDKLMFQSDIHSGEK